MKKYIIITIIIMAAFFLQTALMPSLKIWGVYPDLLAVVIVSISLLQGQWTGSFCGLFAGFLLDAMFSASPGIYTAQYAIVGFIGGFGGKVRIRAYRFVLPLILSFAAVAVKETAWPVYAFFMRVEMRALTVGARILWRAVYTTIVMFIVYQPLYLLHKAEFMGVNRLFSEPADKQPE